MAGSALVAVLAAVSGAAAATGQVRLVSTHGVSMQPLYHQDDLVMVVPAAQYRVGDVVAYRLPDVGAVVLHRIVGGGPAGFRIKGDNNQSVDATRPTAAQLLGHAVLRIPGGGLVYRPLTSAPALAAVALAVVGGGGTTALTRRDRKRKRRTTMPRHVTPPPGDRRQGIAMSGPLQAAGVLAIAIGLGAGVIGAAAWASPLEHTGRAAPAAAPRMHFSYSAHVRPSPAYDGVIVTAPQPVFRKLAEIVELHYAYRGDPGTIDAVADLSTTGGWHSIVSLGAPVRFGDRGYDGTASLDLNSIEARASAAAAVTGMPASPVFITIRPTVRTTGGTTFRPSLELTLTPLTLTVTHGANSLTAVGSAPAGRRIPQANTIGPAAWNVRVDTARVISAAALLAALLTAAIVLTFGRHSAPRTEGEAIRRRYSALLVRVRPNAALGSGMVVDVAEFSTLARLAERYGLLVLHWSEDGSDTFVVQEETASYRYCTTPATAVWPVAMAGPLQARRSFESLPTRG